MLLRADVASELSGVWQLCVWQKTQQTPPTLPLVFWYPGIAIIIAQYHVKK